MNASITEKAGATLVFDRAGKAIASYEGMDVFSTVYDMLEPMQYKDGNAVKRLKDAEKKVLQGLRTTSLWMLIG